MVPLVLYQTTIQIPIKYQQEGKTNLSRDGLNPAHVPCWQVNKLTLAPGCERRIGRADIEESKSGIAVNAPPPQASYPCGNFSDTSRVKLLRTKGSIGHDFSFRIHTENPNQANFFPFNRREVSVPSELTLGHLRYHLTDVPPQPNSPPEIFLYPNRPQSSLARRLERCYELYPRIKILRPISAL